MDNLSNRSLPFNMDYINIMNPYDKRRIFQQYQQLNPYLPTANSYNNLRDMQLQAIAQNIVQSKYPYQYNQLQNYLQSLYGRQ